VGEEIESVMFDCSGSVATQRRRPRSGKREKREGGGNFHRPSGVDVYAPFWLEVEGTVLWVIAEFKGAEHRGIGSSGFTAFGEAFVYYPNIGICSCEESMLRLRCMNPAPGHRHESPLQLGNICTCWNRKDRNDDHARDKKPYMG